jgi:hypothetical protein
VTEHGDCNRSVEWWQRVVVLLAACHRDWMIIVGICTKTVNINPIDISETVNKSALHSGKNRGIKSKAKLIKNAVVRNLGRSTSKVKVCYSSSDQGQIAPYRTLIGTGFILCPDFVCFTNVNGS